jgi:retinol dehydrogenase 13
MRIGKKYEDKEKQFGKTVIITGADSGIGFETASEMAKRGAKVIMACRNMEKCEKAKEKIINETFNRRVECKLCDLASFESIRNFTNDINKSNFQIESNYEST